VRYITFDILFVDMSIERLTSSIEGNDFATMRASTDAAGNDTLNAVRWTGVR